MPIPQSGITAEANTDALFLTLLINQDQTNLDTIKKVCAEIPVITSNLANQYPDARLTSTISIGSEAWDCLYPHKKPEQLHPFKPFKSGHREAPATPGHLLLHIRSNRKDLNFALMHDTLERFGDSVLVEEDICGFRYLDSRDLTGFVDGTENPTGENRAQVALVGSEDATFAGGSYIHCQRYIHKLTQWNQQPVAQQEEIIGRTKTDNIEFSAEQKAPHAHIKRVNIKDDQGKGMEILRHSMPYGNSKEAGLFFIAYGKTPLHFELMLEKMIMADSHGHYDHLMDYSDAVTGCAFFAPSIEFLSGSVL